MGSISNYLENELLDHVLKVGAFTQPANLYIALSTADPLDDGSGLSEPGVGSYARVVCNSWETATNRHIENSASISYPQATADWGTITHIAIMDDPTAGNMIAHGALSSSVAVLNGNVMSFDAGEIDVYWSSGRLSNYLANALLDHVFGGDTYTPPTNIYVALATATITDATDGTSITEPGSNYARVNHNTWNTAAAGASSNNGAITYTQATGDWGTVIQTALTDALTGGNILLHKALDNSRAITTGDDPSFADTAFAITMD
jgi:hypothetical protein